MVRVDYDKLAPVKGPGGSVSSASDRAPEGIRFSLCDLLGEKGEDTSPQTLNDQSRREDSSSLTIGDGDLNRFFYSFPSL